MHVSISSLVVVVGPGSIHLVAAVLAVGTLAAVLVVGSPVGDIRTLAGGNHSRTVVAAVGIRSCRVVLVDYQRGRRHRATYLHTGAAVQLGVEPGSGRQVQHCLHLHQRHHPSCHPVQP